MVAKGGVNGDAKWEQALMDACIARARSDGSTDPKEHCERRKDATAYPFDGFQKACASVDAKASGKCTQRCKAEASAVELE